MPASENFSLFPFLGDAFSFEFFRRAVWTAALIGFANGFLSGYVVLRRSALMVGSMSHSLLPGIAVAVLLTGLSAGTAFVGALFSALLVGLTALFMARTSRIDSHTALAVLYTTAFAGGLVILDKVPVQTELEHWLFGNILALSNTDLWTSFGTALVILVSLVAFGRPLQVSLFEPRIAESLGMPVRRLNYLLTTLVIVGLVVSIQAVGCILSVAMLVAPAAAVIQFAKSPNQLVWISAALGGTVSALAVLVAYAIDLRVGATIVLGLGSVVVLSYRFGPRSGALRRLLQRRPGAHA